MYRDISTDYSPALKEAYLKAKEHIPELDVGVHKGGWFIHAGYVPSHKTKFVSNDVAIEILNHIAEVGVRDKEEEK
jgi:hypothetical protein